MREEVILASKSPFRAQLMANAGIEVEICGSNLDERAAEAAFSAQAEAGAEQESRPQRLAQFLAEAKAQEVSGRFADAVVIGCDQVLELEGQILHKAADEEEAFRRLAALSGREHRLHSAYAIVKGGALLSSCQETARLTMRDLSPAYIRSYLKKAGKEALKSVGVYQIEGPGIRLFERIEGDYWSIIGLPLLPLLRDLRRLGAAEGV